MLIIVLRQALANTSWFIKSSSSEHTIETISNNDKKTKEEEANETELEFSWFLCRYSTTPLKSNREHIPIYFLNDIHFNW